MPIRFGLRHPPCVPASDVASFAAQAESAGFEAAMFPDSQFLWRDVWATMSVAATATSSIALSAAVTNFETRNVAVTAAAAATVEELAPGRVRVGVGTGDSSIKTLGIPPTKLARMGEQVTLLRELLSGQSVVPDAAHHEYGGRAMRIHAAGGRPIPIYMAATGPRALRVAGEIADGVIVLAGMTPALIERALGHVRSGIESSGRTAADVDVWLAAHTAVATDEHAGARLVKPLVITASQLGGAAALASVGIEVDVPPVVEGIYPDVTHAVEWEEAIAAAEEYVSDADALTFARNFTLAGPPEAIAERIEVAAELGIDGFYVLGYSSYELPTSALTAFRDVVIPHFA
ncbi:MAG: LLM class flavin-dependent oxidoreductase [Solirubrobacterales bacterium]